MESYSEFLNRINSFEKPELGMDEDFFVPSYSVLQKVNENNLFNPFFGDTVVFNLDNEIKRRIFKLIDILYNNVGECFCEKLKESTIHMTLHDLSNSTDFSVIKEQSIQNETNLRTLLSDYPGYIKFIKMRTNYVINMVNTSIVLTLYPADEKEYKKLMTLYEFVDQVRKLPYPFTPHITLAYYNCFGFKKDLVHKLKEIVKQMNESNFDLLLDTNQLVYQRFSNMNCYENVFCLRGQKTK